MTSRRHSVASLIRVRLDAEVARAIDGYAGAWNRELLTGFVPSRIWSGPAGGAAILIEPQDELSRLGAALRSAAIWRQKVREAIHSAQRSRQTVTRKECERFCATLDVVISFIDAFNTLKPARTDVARGARQPRRTSAEPEFCELCWRLPQATEEKPGPSLVGRRFCAEHDPQQPNSAYWRDRRYKRDFDAEIRKLEMRRRWCSAPLGTSAVELEHDMSCPAGARLHIAPVTAHPEDMRRAAFALVTSGLRGTREACLIMRSQGATNAEIAASLNISDRAVRLALETARKRLARAMEIRWG